MIITLAVLLAAVQSEPQKVVLWSDGAPGATGKEEADIPSITVYRAPEDKATGTGVVVCPGGGYGHLAVGHEGKEIAEWLNGHGVAAFVLRYRIAPRYHHPAPMLDVQRALRTARSRAKEWKVDPARIGVMGFSAGGHLASTAATHFDDGKADAKDAVDRAGCRPDFAVLVYPVISMTDDALCHKGSRKNLLGDRVDDAELRKRMSSELQVTKQTPPTFLVHTTEDRVVPSGNSIAFWRALKAAGVPGELHIYEKGQHGFGLVTGRRKGPKGWPDRCIHWMRTRGLLEKN